MSAAGRTTAEMTVSAKVNIIMDFLSVKIIFCLHFIIVGLALTCFHWMPQIYLYYNTFFFVLLLYAAHSKSRAIDSICLASIINFVSIIFDIICIIENYQESPDNRRGQICSLIFIIFNLALRPFTTFILARIYFMKKQIRFNANVGGGGGGGADRNGSSLTNTIRKILLINPNIAGYNGRSNAEIGLNQRNEFRSDNYHSSITKSTPLSTALTVSGNHQIFQSEQQQQQQQTMQHVEHHHFNSSHAQQQLHEIRQQRTQITKQTTHAQSTSLAERKVCFPIEPKIQVEEKDKEVVVVEKKMQEPKIEKLSQSEEDKGEETQDGKCSKLITNSNNITIPVIPPVLKEEPIASEMEKEQNVEETVILQTSSVQPTHVQKNEKETVHKQQERIHLTDPETGETYQERMI